MGGNNNKPDPAEWLDYLLLLLVGGMILGACLSLIQPLKYPYSNDTAGYIQEAKNLLLGNGFVRGTGWLDVDRDLAPFALFPPGYPVEIALLALTGLSVEKAAIASSWIAWLLLLPAIAYALRPVCGRWISMAIALLTVTSPGLFEWGYLALSDTNMLLLSVLSIGLIIRYFTQDHVEWYMLALSGVVAGLAYWLRNAAVVLPLTVALFFCLAVILRLQRIWPAMTGLIIWGSAFSLIVIPLFIRNFIVFGDIQPYLTQHGTEDYGLIRAFRLSLWSLLLDMSAWRGVADMAWDAVDALLFLLPIFVSLLWLGVKRWWWDSTNMRLVILLLVIYISLGFAMIVWGRSRFDWVETTLTRQLMPYSWAVLTLAVWALTSGQTAPSRIVSQSYWLVILFLVMLVGRGEQVRAGIWQELQIEEAVEQAGDYSQAAKRLPGTILTNRIKLDISHNHELKLYILRLPANAHVISNFGSVLSVETQRLVRPFDATPDNLAALDDLVNRLNGKPLVVIVIPTNAVLRNRDYAHWQERILSKIGSPYSIELRTANYLAIKFI